MRLTWPAANMLSFVGEPDLAAVGERRRWAREEWTPEFRTDEERLTAFLIFIASDMAL